jgi:hypothetical protein
MAVDASAVAAWSISAVATAGAGVAEAPMVPAIRIKSEGGLFRIML